MNIEAIKHRAKRDPDGVWVYGQYVVIPDGLGSAVSCVWELGHDRGTPVCIETVGQFVWKLGILEIYTGDVVKGYKHGDTERAPFIQEVTYRNGTYWFGNFTWIEFLNIFRYVTVVGNIHDNSDWRTTT